MKVLFLLAVAGLLTACGQPGTCNNNISGSSNVGNCGGTGDGDVEVSTPAPVVVPPVVITPEPASEG